MHPGPCRAVSVAADLAVVSTVVGSIAVGWIVFSTLGVAWIGLRTGVAVASFWCRESHRHRIHRGRAAIVHRGGTMPVGRCSRCGLVHETREGRVLCHKLRGLMA